MFTFTCDDLRDCLAETPPLDLLGMQLLGEPSPTDIPRETLVDAVSEIVDYTENCAATARRLSHLAPIPVTTLLLAEFGL